MSSRVLAGLLAAGCVTAAAGGAYVAVRQNAATPVPVAATPTLAATPGPLAAVTQTLASAGAATDPPPAVGSSASVTTRARTHRRGPRTAARPSGVIWGFVDMLLGRYGDLAT